MTCREKLMIEHPGEVDECYGGGCCGCPDERGYLAAPEGCDRRGGDTTCRDCWDREIPETDKPRILDSGTRREFGTGAVRDIAEGKGRCDLIPLDAVGDRTLASIEEFKRTGDILHLQIALYASEFYPEKYTLLLEVSKHFEEGAKKYGESNWQKGIPVHCYIDSAVRHYLKHQRGDKDEPHDRAFAWNILCCIWTCVHKPELIDLPLVQNNNESEE